MSNYNPKVPDEAVNYSEEGWVADFLKKSSIIIAAVCLLLFIVNLIFSFIFSNISPEHEVSLVKKFYANKSEYSHYQENVYALVSALNSMYSDKIEANVRFTSDAVPNAYMMPGGVMTLTAGFLELVRSENELSFVICHELGHFYKRHILKNLGRTMGPALLLSAIDSFTGAGLSSVLSNGLGLYQMDYSRELESDADLFALTCVNNYYGHVGGATDFFQHIKNYKESISSLNIPENKITEFMSTHPNTGSRITSLQNEIKKQSLLIEDTIPFIYNLKN